MSAKNAPVWRVLNKSDLLPHSESQPRAENASSKDLSFWVSAKQQKGMTELLNAIVDHFKLGEQQETPFSARVRQVDVLSRVMQSLAMTVPQTPPELMAQDLRDMQDMLSEITGVVTNDDVLASLFSNFCIGK